MSSGRTFFLLQQRALRLQPKPPGGSTAITRSGQGGAGTAKRALSGSAATLAPRGEARTRTTVTTLARHSCSSSGKRVLRNSTARLLYSTSSRHEFSFRQAVAHHSFFNDAGNSKHRFSQNTRENLFQRDNLFMGLVSILSATTVISLWAVSPTTTELEFFSRKSFKQPNDEEKKVIIEVDFMEKLANKPYLKYFQEQKNYGGMESGGGGVHENSNTTNPLVPSTLRIMTIDVPQVTNYLGGTCRVAADRIYPDGVVTDEVFSTDASEIKRPNRKRQGENTLSSSSNNNNRSEKSIVTTVSVEQKALVTSYVECWKQSTSSKNLNQVGIEVTQASIARLNPRNLRKTRRFNSNYTKKKRKNETPPAVAVEGAAAVATVDQEILDEDDHDAPWYQTAWVEELDYRLSGRVGFGEAMQPAHHWKRKLFGDIFETTTVSDNTSLWGWLLSPPVFLWNAMTTSKTTTTTKPITYYDFSSKPHVVIANGAALQLIPQSLRLLKHTCQQNDIPLYVIDDPRSWGGANTHANLEEVLQTVRSSTKSRLINHALHSSSPFQAGRTLGQWEADTKWRSKEVLRTNKELLEKASSSAVSFLQEQRIKRQDWSQLTTEQLEQELTKRNVMAASSPIDEHESSSSALEANPTDASTANETTTTTTTSSTTDSKRWYSAAMIALARKCIHEVRPTENVDDPTKRTE